MVTLGKVELEEIRQTLLAERARLQEQLEDAESSGLGRNPDRADLAIDYSQREQRTALTAIHEEQLAGIQAALERIENDTYGICAHCGQPIDVARLRVLPSATTCVDCRRVQQ